jgi:zinc/manganese transport system permease protein
VFAGFMVNAWIVASIVAVVGGVVGFFVVLRGSAFAAHAIPTGGFAGAAAAALAGTSTLLGLGVFALLGALGIGAIGHRRRRDVATALVLAFALGLGALLLSRTSEYAPEIYSLLFGEVLGISPTELLPTIAMAIVSVLAIAVLYRPLMLSSVLDQVAQARGIGVLGIELGFLIVLALATTVTVPVVGALLIFSLMIGPPAAARAFTSRPAVAIALSIAFALVCVWAAIALSYQSNLPIGFFVGTISAAEYLLGRTWAAVRERTTITIRR